MTATEYARGGLRVVPWRPDKAGSMLPGRRWKEEATTDLATIRSWAPLFAAGLTAVVVPDGVKVLDVDYPDRLNGHVLPDGGAVRIGGRGTQYWVADTGRGGILPNKAGELKGPGSIVVVPGGSDKYSWATDVRPWDAQPEAPDWAKAAARATFEDLDVDEAIPDGERNERLYDLAGDLRGIGFSERNIYAALRGENASCDPRMEDLELRTIARSAASVAPGFHKVPRFIEQGRPPLDQTQPAWPAPPSDLIYHGLAGEVVNAVREQTEADPVALLLTVLTAFSAFTGPHLVGQLSGSPQPSNIFSVLVGPTGVGRKGTSYLAIEPVFRMQAKWEDLLVSGLQSGEALIRQMADRQAHMPMALVYESELGSVLINLGRENSTLSQAMRHAFDGDRLMRIVARAHESNEVRDHHISLLAHVTPEELRERLTIEQAQNGFANRVLWACVKKAHDVKPAPDPGPFVKPFAKELGASITHAQKRSQVPSSPQAQRLFAELATRFEGTRRIGLHAAVTARMPTITTRLALTYAALDRSKQITSAHVNAAQAVADYGSRSALHVFGDLTGNRRADMIREFLRDGQAYSRTQLMGELRMAGEAVYDGLAVLRSMGLIQEWQGAPGPKGGRRAEMVASAETGVD